MVACWRAALAERLGHEYFDAGGEEHVRQVNFAFN
jgi:hypothetical protein